MLPRSIQFTDMADRAFQDIRVRPRNKNMFDRLAEFLDLAQQQL